MNREKTSFLLTWRARWRTAGGHSPPALPTTKPRHSRQHMFYVRVADSLADAEPFAGGEDPAAAGLSPVGSGDVWATPAWQIALRDAGLASCPAVMGTLNGVCSRALADRENWRLTLPCSGVVRSVYLKKHHTRSWCSRLRATLGLGPHDSPGRHEARNVRKLEAAGIPCMELAAFGERLRHDGLLESFLITPELEGFTQLDDFLRGRFRVLTNHPERRDPELRRLIARVAAIARQFHEAGFNHRDLYCCHFFVHEDSSGDFEIRLIDLQRVQHRRRLRRRWLVKDLAQLAYSAPRDRIKCTHKMAFIRHYFGVRKLRPEHKRFVRAVLAKQRAMERKQGMSR